MKNLYLAIAFLFYQASFAQNLISNLSPGSIDSNPRNFLESSENGDVYFFASTGGPFDLYRSDRTPSGAITLPANSFSNPNTLIESNQRIYYYSQSTFIPSTYLCWTSTLNNSVHNCKTLGSTALGTTVNSLIEFNGEIYFFGSFQNNGGAGIGSGLFQYDVALDTFHLKGPHSEIEDSQEMDGKLYYVNTDTLWSFDGNLLTPIAIGVDVIPPLGDRPRYQVVNLNGTNWLYFIGRVGSDFSIIKTDGTSSNTSQMFIPQLTGLSNPEFIAIGGNSTGFYAVYRGFSNFDYTYLLQNTNGFDLTIVDTLQSSGLSNEIGSFTPASSLLYWRLDKEVFMSDGSLSGKQSIGFFGNPSPFVSPPGFFNTLGNSLYFAGEFGSNGKEIIEIAGNPDSIFVYDLNPNGGSLDGLNARMTLSGNRIYAAADNGTLGYEPYYLDATVSSLYSFGKSPKIQVYPNPSQGEFEIKLPKGISHNFSFILIDALGRSIPFKIHNLDENTVGISTEFRGVAFIIPSGNRKFKASKILIR